jgi:RNA polymerase sigma-70 factor (ECF subfamily)
MVIRDVTLSDVERLEAQAAETEVAFEMDEETFRAFYERTARPLWVYLSRIAGDRQAADDLLQETYYRFLRAHQNWESESHRRAYLYRIATNLVRDRHRRALTQPAALCEANSATLASRDESIADATARHADLQRAMARLKPRERALLWLAYAQEHPHSEIAETLGVATGSVKLLLFRARRRLAGFLRGERTRISEGTDRGDR